MKIEDQLSSQELSKKLEELKVKQDSLWYWCEERDRQNTPVTGIRIYEKSIAKSREYNCQDLKIFSAFTVAELGEMLPQLFHHKEHKRHYRLYCDTFKNTRYKWFYFYEWKPDNERLHYVYGTTESNTRAKMLIYLIENNLLPKGNNA